MVWQKIISLTKDLLFPIYCVQCKKEGEWWCASCRSDQIKLHIEQPGGALAGLSSFLSYEPDSPCYHLIRQFKYNYASDVTALWREVIDVTKLSRTWPNDLVVVPVPLHAKRERERGFNQAQLLGSIIREQLSGLNKATRLADGELIRERTTAQQALLNREERLLNVFGAFVWRGENPPGNILLVDDVYTTGATMGECARVLRSAGAPWVWAITLARGV
ncbi:MAG: ComF family protein [bacterium]|nr:ComF family protein [bacterium]